MTNPLVHAIAFAAAVLIPGGLLVYFAWRAISLKASTNQSSDSEQSEPIPETRHTPEDVRADFERMFPKDSLRANSRLKRLDRLKTFRRRKSKN
jgi:hypothetical protein